MFMGATVFEIAGGSARPDPPLVKGVGTKSLGKGKVNKPKLVNKVSYLLINKI